MWWEFFNLRTLVAQAVAFSGEKPDRFSPCIDDYPLCLLPEGPFSRHGGSSF